MLKLDCVFRANLTRAAVAVQNKMLVVVFLMVKMQMDAQIDRTRS